MKVYLDRGAKPDRALGVMGVAAAVFEAERFKQFSRKWNRLLRGLNVSAFQATDFYNRAGECALVPKGKLDSASRLISTRLRRLGGIRGTDRYLPSHRSWPLVRTAIGLTKSS